MVSARGCRCWAAARPSHITLRSRGNLLVRQTTVDEYDPDGRPLEVTPPEGPATYYTYDEIGRQTLVSDGRVDTYTVYDPNGVSAVYTTEVGETTKLSRTTYGYDDGRVVAVGQAVDPNDPNSGVNYTRYDYNDRGQITHVWGDVPYPTLTEYDDFGQRYELTTFRDETLGFTGSTWPAGVDNTDGDTTTWTYDAVTGRHNGRMGPVGFEPTTGRL